MMSQKKSTNSGKNTPKDSNNNSKPVDYTKRGDPLSRYIPSHDPKTGGRK